ncbi:MAG: YheC/YheD family protein [Bacillota bacterium]
MRYIVKKNPTSSQTILLHHSKVKKDLIQNRMNLRFGVLEAVVTVSVHFDEESTIYLSEDLIKELGIPLFIHYEIKLDEMTIQVGPVIGLLIKGKMEELTAKRIKIYKKYLFDYKHTNGLVLLITSDCIPNRKKSIKAYAYDPNTNQWKKGVYPFPSVVFLRKRLKERTRGKLEKLIGRNYYNSHVFNKWDVWKWFSSNKLLHSFFAETILANNEKSLWSLLNKHQGIYLKPITGMQGAGIYHLKKEPSHYQLSYRMNNRNKTTILNSWEAVKDFLNRELMLDHYIAQQELRLLKDHRRMMDFRVIASKDSQGYWTVPGIITKLGEKDSIVSNISSGGIGEKTWDTLLRIYKDEPIIAYKKYAELETLALRCCKVLDEKGLHLGYIGIDVGMDEDHKLWIIEINNRSPDMTIALDALDYQLYYKIKSAPIHYAKWLAGFRGGSQ